MAVNCDPNALAAASACFCSDEASQRAQIIYLLNIISGLNLTPAQLAANAACYCGPEDLWRGEVTLLLCSIVNK
jgi:hypothetical protein